MTNGEKRLYSVRGATGVARDRKEDLVPAVHELVEQLMRVNGIREEALVHILFSVTRDIRSMNAAGALRRFGFAGVPLFCVQEPVYRGSCKRMIRVLLTYYGREGTAPVAVYRNGAEKLRPDLAAPLAAAAGDPLPKAEAAASAP